MAMDRSALMQRVVGAVVLVSLAVIFLPMLLRPVDDKLASAGSSIPAIPENVSTLVFKRDQQGVFQSTGPASIAPSQNANTMATTTTTTTTTPVGSSGSSLGDAWMVQLGSYSNEAAATALREKLRAKHHPTYVERVDAGAGPESWRVKVGPELSQATAQALKKRLEKETGLKAVLVKHGG